jgi:hypothetical protein
VFKRAEREKIAWQAILVKEPACGKGPDSYREGEGLRRKKSRKNRTFETYSFRERQKNPVDPADFRRLNLCVLCAFFMYFAVNGYF